MSSSSPRADSMMIGMLRSARMRLHTSRPSRPGSITSSTTRSTASRSTTSSASSPAGRRDHREPGVAEGVLDDRADGLLVLDHQDAVGHWGPPPAPARHGSGGGGGRRSSSRSLKTGRRGGWLLCGRARIRTAGTDPFRPTPPGRRRPPAWLTGALLPAVVGGLVVLGGLALTGNLGGDTTTVVRDPTPLPARPRAPRTRGRGGRDRLARRRRPPASRRWWPTAPRPW